MLAIVMLLMSFDGDYYSGNKIIDSTSEDRRMDSRVIQEAVLFACVVVKGALILVVDVVVALIIVVNRKDSQTTGTMVKVPCPF